MSKKNIAVVKHSTHNAHARTQQIPHVRAIKVKCLTEAVAINVGANTKPEWGGFRGPIFSDGSFEFIPIPWKAKYGMIVPRPKKYGEMIYSSYVPDGLKNEYVFISPNFDNCTYASTKGAPANKPILALKQGDYLLFYATLRFMNNKGYREDWINPHWGAYIIGLFEIASVHESIYHVLGDESAIEAFKEYDWFKIQMKDPDDWNTPWVKGIKEKSGLLEKTIPLSSPEDSRKWHPLAYDLFKTVGGNRLDLNKKAGYRTILTCRGKRLDSLLAQCILRKDNK